MISGAGREVLARSRLHVLGVLLQQPLVGIAFHVSVERHPVLAVDQVRDEPLELRRVLDAVLALAEDDTHHARSAPEFGEDVTVVDLQIVTVTAQERLPVEVRGYERGAIERSLGLLVGHFQEQQVSQLLDVVAVGQPVVAKNVAVVPELLNQAV